MKLTWLALPILAISTVCLGGSAMNSVLNCPAPPSNVKMIAGVCDRAIASGVLVMTAVNVLTRPSFEASARSMWGE